VDYRLHAYQPDNGHKVWGWGFYHGAIWEYFGAWSPKKGLLELSWQSHDREGLLKTIAKTEPMSLAQKSAEEMNKFIPSYLDKLNGNFIFVNLMTRKPEATDA